MWATPGTRIPTLLIVFCVRVLLHVDGYGFRPNYIGYWAIVLAQVGNFPLTRGPLHTVSKMF